MAAGLPLPQKLFAHGWWMNDGQKMSKSIGNVIDPYAIVDKYGRDQVRYFMINEVPFGSDGDFSDTRMSDCINAKLSNDLGNLAYRTLSFAYKHCDGATPVPQPTLDAADEEMLSAARQLLGTVRGMADNLQLHRMTMQMNMVVQQANRYIDTQAPWALKKTSPERMQTVLWVLMETLRHVGVVQQPVTPTISRMLLDQIACPSDERSFVHLTPEYALKGGTPLPKPQIIVPRYEPSEEDLAVAAAAAEAAEAEEAAAAGAASALSEAEIAELEELIKAQGERVRRSKEAVKAGSADKDELDLEVGALLELKTRLPEDHELRASGKKKKKKKAGKAA